MSQKRRTRRPWTDACTAQLRVLAAEGLPGNQIGRRMGRAGSVIRTKCAQLQIPLTIRRKGPVWTPARDALIRNHYPDMQTRELALMLGTSLPAVYGRANALGVHKSDAFNASARSGRIRTDEQRGVGRDTRFQPGHETWNKGVPGSTGLHPNSVKHHFKAGDMAGAAQYNYLPVGSETVRRSSNLLMRKLTDDPAVSPPSRWQPVHTLLWEAAHGPVPDGMVCVFKPGQRTTQREEITLDRIEVITRAELMQRNSIMRYPEKMVDLMRTRGQLVRRINYVKKTLENKKCETK